MTKPIISVIVPVHNGGDYFRACIESALAQSFGDFEILLMENFSTDGSYEASKSYALKDSRIKVFKLDVKGICFARNKGLEAASGDWVVFMDNDDFISPDHLEALYECVSVSGAGVGVAPFAAYYGEDKIKRKEYVFGPGIYEGEEKAVLISERVVWSRIYSRRLIMDNGVRFDQTLEKVEDWPFYTEVLLLSDKAAVTDRSSYYYRQGRPGQASAGVSFRSVERNFRALARVGELLEKYGGSEAYKPYYDCEFAKEIIGKTFGATPLKNLSGPEIVKIIDPLKPRLLRMRLNGDLCRPWMIKWFGYFQYWLKKGNYASFFKLMRMYKNFILQPLGIKIR